MRLFLAEKPSLARAIADNLNRHERFESPLSPVSAGS